MTDKPAPKYTYLEALHAVQTGVAMEMQISRSVVDPKHLRVGINSAHITDRGLATLLMEKGLFTLEEYKAAMAVAANQEVEEYEVKLREMLGGDAVITLA